ncbi:BQ5605_C011g06402 [Microbotryum silenes-dioicae]|uniref:BQ5605_C011g06402 protein n=1 Tax=Microbotryum silenes-dioicae TaxID=796604 RepID=A0A2X0LT77_9BASI|nr:BQ5605_C011g06402 [Microbotryum silenes-dioicae]
MDPLPPSRACSDTWGGPAHNKFESLLNKYKVSEVIES